MPHTGGDWQLGYDFALTFNPKSVLVVAEILLHLLICFVFTSLQKVLNMECKYRAKTYSKHTTDYMNHHKPILTRNDDDIVDKRINPHSSVCTTTNLNKRF